MNEEVIEFLEEHDRPFATAKEIANEMGVKRSAFHDRKQELIESGNVCSMKVGASAEVFWIPERDVTLEC